MRVATKPGVDDFYVFKEVKSQAQPVGQSVQLTVRGDQAVVIATGLTADGRMICVYTWRHEFVCGFRCRLVTWAAWVLRQIRVFSIAVGS